MSPSARQVRITSAVVGWYLKTYFRTRDDPGVTAMFCDRTRVGAFAIDRADLARRDDRALFRLLMAMTMFQRRQDVQILRILRGIRRADVEELTSPRRLLRLVDQGKCGHLLSTEALHDRCDLGKDPVTRTGCCTQNPTVGCHLKRHTVLLKRYGHFGKVPTSLALVLREANAAGVADLRRAVFRRERDPLLRAQAMEAALSRAWRVNQKIASMFLSAVSNPDLGGTASWARGMDWTYFVVVDSNVDLFLASIGYRGGRSYDARRNFLRALAAKIDLQTHRPGIRSYNPRIVQQAAYLFMSTANRRAADADCTHIGPRRCATCPPLLAERCPVRRPS